mmetsp:Transcript_12476/g.33376  ORF Transcript_12476/g.33376 Transcript_12476/m.33376 type:complete len:92 (-) Transcript_12476:172-447(-)
MWKRREESKIEKVTGKENAARLERKEREKRRERSKADGLLCIYAGRASAFFLFVSPILRGICPQCLLCFSLPVDDRPCRMHCMLQHVVVHA